MELELMRVEIINFEGVDHAFKVCRNSELAKKEAKKEADKTCAFSNNYRVALSGCHIYSAGSVPELKCYPINIICLRPEFHTTIPNTLDITESGCERPANERIEFILEYCHPEQLGFIRRRLELLEILARYKGVMR